MPLIVTGHRPQAKDVPGVVSPASHTTKPLRALTRASGRAGPKLPRAGSDGSNMPVCRSLGLRVASSGPHAAFMPRSGCCEHLLRTPLSVGPSAVVPSFPSRIAGRAGVRTQPETKSASEICASASMIVAAKDDLGVGKRAGDEDYKILFLQRSTTGTFRGALVFPGGATEVADDPVKWPQLFPGAQARDHLGAHRICAVRETFEECGVLFTTPTPEENGTSWQALEFARDEVQRDACAFHRFCSLHRLIPDVNRLVYFSRWITPANLSRRFDTHFFLFASPSPISRLNDAISVDGGETVKAEWLRPSEALRAAQESRIDFWPPQFHAVAELTRYAPRHADIERVFRGREVVTYLPEVNREGDAIFGALPGDVAHSLSRSTARPGDRNRFYSRLDQGNLKPYRMENNINRESKI